MKTFLRKVLLIAVLVELVGFYANAIAQPQPVPKDLSLSGTTSNTDNGFGDPDGVEGGEVQVPIDNGVLYLFGAGLLSGAYAFRKKLRNQFESIA